MVHIAKSKTIKVAIACSGLGLVRRGFEAFAQDLFQHLQSMREISVVLFKGGGPPARREIPLWNLPRNSQMWRGVRRWIDPYVGEQMTFAPQLVRHLKKGFDLVHTSDGQLGSSLLRLSPGISRKFRIIFSNGGPMSPNHYDRFDYIQQVNPVELSRASAYGFPGSRMKLIPYGVSLDHFGRGRGVEVRDQLGISQGVSLILTVGAHGTHKRLEFLINTMATVEKDIQLLIVGEENSAKTVQLKKLADHVARDRVTFATFPHELMPAVYASADLYAHTALREGFGLSVLEAMASGLPIVYHSEPGLGWVVGGAGVEVDMTDEEQVSDTLNSVLADPTKRARLSERGRKRVEKMFSWETLLPQYLSMYEQALDLPLNL